MERYTTMNSDGFLVLHDTAFRVNLTEFQRRFDETIQSFPEYRNTDKVVMGGFSALGNSSSFHNLFVRECRELALKEILPSLRDQVSPDEYLEMLPDRMLYRPAGESPSPESWHRDETPNALPEDIIIGGWVNLDSHPQQFSCVAGTHRESRGNGGFEKVPKERHAELKEKKQLVTIPPGGIILFHEHILHEVVAGKKNYPMRRLFIGARVTKSATPLTPNLDQLLEEQAVLPLKSGQIPPMYATLHWTNWGNRLAQWSQKTFKEELLIDRTYVSGKRAGETLRVIPKIMPSLRELGMKYEDYSEHEKAILKPARRWVVRGPSEGLYLELVL